MSALITRASISSVTPGRVAIRAPARWSPYGRRWESDWTVGQDDVRRRHRGGDRRRRLGRMRGTLGHHAQHPLGADFLGLGPQPLAEARVAGLHTTSTSSPSRTARQSRTTALTA